MYFRIVQYYISLCFSGAKYTFCGQLLSHLFFPLAPAPSCELYTGNVCYARGVIGKDYVFIKAGQSEGTVANQAYYEGAMVNFNSSLETIVSRNGAPSFCVDDILSLLCFHTFPVCDYNSNTSVPRQVCTNSRDVCVVDINSGL